MFRVVQLSDTHLSAKRPYGLANFERFVEWLNADPPDLVVNTGDLVLDDPDDDDDRAYAHHAHAQIAAPVLVLPGNHDVGESEPQPWENQLVSPERRRRFVETWGADRWVVDRERWRLVGINTQLIGLEDADDEAAAEQQAWIDEQLATAGDRLIALFMHRPLALLTLDEDDDAALAVAGPGRRALMRAVTENPVRVVASGHQHRWRTAMMGAHCAVSAPTTAFHSHLGDSSPLGVRTTGCVEYLFDDGFASFRLVQPAGVLDLDVGPYLATHGAMRHTPVWDSISDAH